MFDRIIANFHIEKLWWIFKKKLKYMIFFGLIGAVLGAGYASYRGINMYSAQISFYVYSNPNYVNETGINQSSSDINSASKLLPSYMQILNSISFLQKVIDSLGIGDNYSPYKLRGMVSAASVKETSVFKVAVADTNPVMAMNIANAIGELAPNEIINIVKSGGIAVIDEAVLPTTPYQSKGTVKFAIIGFAALFGLVFVIAMIRGLLNTVIRRKYEIESLFTIPIIGDVPYKLPKKRKEKVDLILSNNSDFSWKEAYSAIRVGVLFAKNDVKCPIFTVTSSDCGEGKTISTINMGSSYAQLGKRVLLIDADFRNSGMAKAIDKNPSEKALVNYLSGKSNEVEIINFDDNLDVILSGDVPENPSELLSSERFFNLLNNCKEEYDAIFIDSPALGIVSDALVLAKVSTAYFIVVRELVTKFDRVEMIVRKLESVDANISGFIYNCISVKSEDYSLKRYGNEYKKRAEK